MNQVPNAELFFKSGKKLVRKSTHEEFAGRDVLVIGLVGAFNPVDEKMVKDYDKLYNHFKDTTIVGDPLDASHIDEIYFVCMESPWVMDAWWKKMKIKNCKYLPDASGAFSYRLDQQGGLSGGQMVVEMYNKGYGKRSWRYVLLLEDNAQMTYVEEEIPDGAATRDNLDDEPYDLTEPEEVLAFLRKRQQKGNIEAANKASEDLSKPT